MSAPRVFLLDDDASVVRIVAAAAEGQKWEFLSAGSADEGLTAVKKFSPDIILLDVEFPGGGGFEVCRRLREGPDGLKIPVIFLTSRGDVQSRLKGFEAGGQDYVAKPFAVEELLARVRAHLAIKGRIEAVSREKEEMAARDRVRQDLVDMIVHDLRTPLGSIQVALGMLHETGVVSGDEHALLMNCAEGATEFALFMVNDLLDLGAGKIPVKPEPLDIKALSARLEGLFGPPFERHHLSLKMDLGAALPPITTDTTLVFRVLANLLSNAAKFSRTGGEVTLLARAEGPGARFEVMDHGPGIPDAEKKKLFQKYYRADTPESRAVAGTGIGLAFCRMAAEALGGSIRVEDAEGGGSRFVVEIPTAPPAIPGEVYKQYLEDCNAKLGQARQLASQFGGAQGAQAAEKLRGIAHQLAGSAGTYGLSEAGKEAARLETLLKPYLLAAAKRDEKLREQVDAAIEKISSLLL